MMWWSGHWGWGWGAWLVMSLGMVAFWGLADEPERDLGEDVADAAEPVDAAG